MAEKTIIPLNSKSRDQLQALIANQEKLQAHINSYVAGVASALDVPDGWTFDLQSMSFVPVQEQPQAGDTLNLADLED